MWTGPTTSLVALASALTVTLVGPNSGPPDPEPAHALEFVDMPDQYIDIVWWAIDLFDEAQLALPPIRFVYDGDDESSCDGWGGTHWSADGRSTINLCTAKPGSVTEVTVLHEVAHAWAAHSLDDDRRAAFGDLRGWTEWNGADGLGWHENGSEQAAEIIVWGLIDRPIRSVRINDNTCADLDVGYRVLTGDAPLHGYRDRC